MPVITPDVRRYLAIGLVLALCASLLPLAQPAGATGSFQDDDSSPHEQAIEYIAARGVTVGCNPPGNTRFCPDRSITRGEMAAFLQRAFDLPSGNKNRFKDDDNSQFEGAINAIKKAGITLGCNPPANDRFCPNAEVTRGEMAAFMARAIGVNGGPDFFSDDDGTFEDAINAVARVRITRGCNPPENTRYCPSREVTRAEMATFMMRVMEIDRTGTTVTTKPNSTTTTVGTNPPSDPPPAGQCAGVTMTGPSNPQGDVVVQPGQSIQTAANNAGSGATIVIASGVHQNQTVSPSQNQHFVGQSGAILDGGGTTEYAFGGPGDDVVIEGLEIRNYNSDVGEGVIRSVQSSLDWTVRANEIHHNGGQGLKYVGGWKVIGNYFHNNEQYGIGGSGNGVLIERNEIAYNNPNKDVSPYSGAGGTKFVNSRDLVVRGNCSHHNVGPGLWTDGHNINVLYEGNIVFENEHAGIKHEMSCSATIRSNTATNNGFGNPNWLAGAGIVVLNSPGVTVTGNYVEGNADGIAGIQGDRTEVNGRNCTLQLKDLVVSDNVIDMSDGYTGIVTDETDAVFASWNNIFVGNEYRLGGGGDWFHWNGQTMTLSQWQTLGNG